MNGELIWVLSLLAVAIVLFATGRVRMDAVALFVIVAFALSGTLTVPEVFSGFSDPNVVLIAALFIIGDGLVRTGVATVMGTWLVKVAGNSEIKMLVLLMLTVAGLGAFMSSTGVVAIFIPVVLSVAMRMQTSPSRLMMPLSFAGLISGMMTLVATPPNLVVNSELLREGYHGFSFFSVTPIGLVVLVLGILYMLVMRFMLKGDTQTPQREGWTRRTFRDLIREYRLTGRARRLAIRPGSPMIGQRLDDLKLRERYGANVIGVERWRRFRRVIVNVNGVSEFRARDVLLIDMSAADVDLRQFCSEQLLEPMVLRGEYFSDQALDVGMAEISLIPESELIGKSVREIGFRTRYGLNVVGLKRNGVALEGSLADEPLLLGDITRTGTHDQTFQRGQAHRGVNAFTVADSRNGTTVAQVAGDDVQFFYRFVQHFCRFLGYIEVAGAVRAVTTDAVLFVQVVRQGVEVRLFRHSLVERGVKYSNVFVFQLWERFQSFFDTDQVSRVVQRCKRSCIFDTLNNRLIDHYGAGILFAAVYDTVTDSSQLRRQFWFLCQNSINDKVERFAVSGACT